MRFFHISDLHFGKLLYGYDLTEEHRNFIEQLGDYCDKYNPDAVLIAGDVYLIKKSLHLFTRNTQASEVNQHQVIICTTGNDVNASFLKSFAKCLRVLNDHFCIFFKFRLECFFETYGFGSNHMHQRTALYSREYSFVKVEFLCILCTA